MPAQSFSGSATIGTTEFSLPNNSTTLTPRTEDLTLQVWIDFANMAAGDQYQVKVKEKMTGSGDTQRLLYEPILTGAQSSPLIFPPLIVLHGWDVTVAKLAGTDRSIVWSLRSA